MNYIKVSCVRKFRNFAVLQARQPVQERLVVQARQQANVRNSNVLHLGELISEEVHAHHYEIRSHLNAIHIWLCILNKVNNRSTALEKKYTVIPDKTNTLP